MLRKLLTVWLITLALLVLPGSVLAQEYYFGVPQEDVNVYLNADGTMSLDYVWTVVNQPGAHVIDFYDVGMPNANYDINSVQADVNGVPVSISTSDYLGSGSGFSVDLGSQAIQPGETGKIHVNVGNIPRMVYPDSQDSNYASAEFKPSYFGSQYITGNTDLSVTFHLPPGIKPEEPRYHLPEGWVGTNDPVAGLDSEGRVTYTWQSNLANAWSVYTFGASFPKSYVPADAIVTAPLFDFAAIGVFFSNFMSNLTSYMVCACFAFFFVVMPIIGGVQNRRRKLQYLPPKISIEGHGIKRGLTAVEAAILMEEPLDKVLTMILFSTVKKGAATVVSREPLKIDVNEVPENVELQDYERNFLEAFKQEGPEKRRAGLQAMMVSLVKSVAEKMKGFSRRETVDYYKSIMEKAWQQVEQANTPEVKGQAMDENLEWTMLDRNYENRTRNAFTGPVFVPMWWGRYDPGWHATAAPSGGLSVPSAGRGSGGSLPGAAFAASIVNGTQTFSSRVVGNVSDFTSKVTGATNPPPPPSTRSGYHGGGGGGCACACACAGCACACAGGGR